MHLFLSAGEPSGDLHASNLARELLAQDPSAKLVGYGGDRMAAAGVDLHYPLTQLAIMWFGRAMLHLPKFFKLARQAEVYLRSAKPDALVVTDYPGFHFAMVKRAHRVGVPAYFFVPPQLWAWAGWRSEKMRKWVRTVLTAMPFEEKWYRDRGVHTHYVGHPYFDEIAGQRIDAAFVAAQKAAGGPLVALLPGSRGQEVADNFALMLATAAKIRAAVPDARFLVAAFNEKQAGVVRGVLAGSGVPAEIHVGRTPDIIEAADAAVAVSGSVGLELMCRLTPTVVVYKISPFARFVSRQFMTCPYISLVNMLADEELFPEFLTTKFDPDALAAPVIGWLKNPDARAGVCGKLKELRAKAAVPGACKRAADYIRADLAARPRRVGR
ncbi:MAG: lipid-A-disaccharide synthase [Fimbriiglobus sp.]